MHSSCTKTYTPAVKLAGTWRFREFVETLLSYHTLLQGVALKNRYMNLAFTFMIQNTSKNEREINNESVTQTCLSKARFGTRVPLVRCFSIAWTLWLWQALRLWGRVPNTPAQSLLGATLHGTTWTPQYFHLSAWLGLAYPRQVEVKYS
jgi:hypothetical protein